MEATIAKAMAQITELSKDVSKNANQLTRWVVNKEAHAKLIQQTILDYFLAHSLSAMKSSC